MYPPPASTTHYDQQDIVNQMLAAALHARATLQKVVRTAALLPVDEPQATADLTDAATALTRIHDALLRAADSAGEAGVAIQVDARPSPDRAT